MVSLFPVVDFHTLLSSAWVLWWHGSSCQMCGWIRGVGCTLWQDHWCPFCRAAALREGSIAFFLSWPLCYECQWSRVLRGVWQQAGHTFQTQGIWQCSILDIMFWLYKYLFSFFFLIMMKFKGSCIHSLTKQILTLFSLECVCNLAEI